MNDFKPQPLNIRPYSKSGSILFISLHLIAIGCHLSSFFVGLAYLPKDVLVYPLAELKTVESEIVGPCLGDSTQIDIYCEKANLQTVNDVLQPKYPISIGSDSQPRCDSTNIDGSCGVDIRQREIKFSLRAFTDDKKQHFDEINIMGLLTYVDLVSLIIHTYAYLSLCL